MKQQNQSPLEILLLGIFDLTLYAIILCVAIGLSVALFS